MNKIKIVLLSICAFLLLTGCSNDTIANPDGSILSYNLDELEEGYYIQKDDKYYPLLSYGIGASPVLHQWFSEADQLIPELKKGDKLVFYSPTNVPENTSFTRMTDYGYTLGMRFNVSDNKISIGTNAEDFCQDSTISKYFEQNGSGMISVKEINGMQFKSSMLTPDGYLKGLSKDALYRLGFYQGTVFTELDVLASSHLFVEESTLTSSTYIENKGKVFEIDFPSGMTNGYYVINNTESFKYSAGSNSGKIKVTDETNDSSKENNEEN